MHKWISLFLMIALLVAGCAENPAPLVESSSSLVSSSSDKEDSTISLEPKPQPPELEIELNPNLEKFCHLDLRKDALPHPFNIEGVKRTWTVTMSPDGTFFLTDFQDGYLWDCIKQEKVETSSLYMPTEFLPDSSMFVLSFPIYETYLNNSPEGTDASGEIIARDGSITIPTFAYQIAEKIGKEEVGISVESVYFDETLQRYYVAATLFDSTTSPNKIQYMAAEYDENSRLLGFIIADGVPPIIGKEGYIGHRLVAGGDRYLLTFRNIEFNFNNGTWRKTNYSPDMQNLWRPEILGNGDRLFSIYNGEEFHLRNYDYQHALVGYENGVFQVYYELAEQTEEENPYEVQTEQGPVQMQYTVSGSAPHKDFYFTAPCEEYTWTVSEQWESLLGAEKYTKGVFKTNTDGKIEFICPLPEDVDYIGEDINGLSYFYDKREL